jgi:hypothetical protein
MRGPPDARASDAPRHRPRASGLMYTGTDELPRHFSGGNGTVSTGTFEVRTTRSAVLPIKK